jgi:hypothetical protein
MANGSANTAAGYNYGSKEKSDTKVESKGSLSGTKEALKDAKRKKEDTKKIKELNQLAKKDVITFLDELDQQMINKILSKKNVIDYILKYGKDKRIKQWILSRR